MTCSSVRFGLYCTHCMPGYHLPYLAAAAPGGLFAEHGLDVDILEPVDGPGQANVHRVAAGSADFCLTSVAYYLMARAEVPDLAARFVAIVGRRSPMAGIVAAESGLHAPEDLAGRRTGALDGERLLLEYEAALTARGVGAPVLVPLTYADAPAALGRGEIDVVPDFADLVWRVRRQAGIEVRAVRVGAPYYANGVVAGDHVPDDRVTAVREAVGLALERQRACPDNGVEALIDRYPETARSDAIEGWQHAERTIFGSAPVGSMDHDVWEASLAYTGQVHGLPVPEASTVYRDVDAPVIVGRL
ncbi:MAG: ABC transporter substrate-binding protein [Acidimicrobiia bacterium]|nr:ABC transporter substrate-binding protein [Acidimicrobiia bacterium]